MPGARRAPGQVSVLAGRQRLPAAERQVRIAADPEVGSVYMRVAVAQVVAADPLGPGRRARPGPGMTVPRTTCAPQPCLGHHRGQPVHRDLGVGVGVGQPQFPGRAERPPARPWPRPAGRCPRSRR